MRRDERGEDQTSVVHQLVPMFMLIQFLVVLAGLVAGTRLGDPQFLFRARKPSRRVLSLPETIQHD